MNNSQFGNSRMQASTSAAGGEKGGTLKQTLVRLEVSRRSHSPISH